MMNKNKYSKSILLLAAIAATPFVASPATADPLTSNLLTSNQESTVGGVVSAINHVEGYEVISTSEAVDLLNSELPYAPSNLRSEVLDLIDQISPIGLAPMRQMALSDNDLFYGAVTQHFNDIRNNVPGVTTTTTMSKDDKGKNVQPVTVENSDKLSFWSTGLGGFTTNFGSVNSFGNQPESVSDMGGVIVGLDYRASSNLVFGVLGAFQHASSSVNEGVNSRVDLNSGKVGAYGTWWQGGAYVQGYVGGGYDNYDTTRNINALLGPLVGDALPIDLGNLNIGSSASGSANAGEANALLGGGYDWTFGGFKVGPTAALQYSYVGISGFQETGAGIFNLDVKDQTAQSLQSLVGVNAQYTLDMGNGNSLIPFASAKWEHEYLQHSRGITASLDGGNDFTVQTSKPGDDGVLVDAGVSFNIKSRAAIYAAYQGEFFRTNYNSQGIYGGVRFNF